MDGISAGLSRLLLHLDIVNKSNNSDPVLVFAIACAIIGALAVILDFSLFLLQGKSLLNLKHGKKSIILLLAWSIGAFVIGYVGQIVNIFVVSVSATAMVGFGWPILFTKYMKDLADQEGSSEPEQPLTEE